MSKTKNKDRSEVEYLRGQNRKLESQNRQLRKRLKTLDKRAHFYEEIVTESAKEIPNKNTCPECKDGDISTLDMKFVKLDVCNKCEYRKRL